MKGDIAAEDFTKKRTDERRMAHLLIINKQVALMNIIIKKHFVRIKCSYILNIVTPLGQPVSIFLSQLF